MWFKAIIKADGYGIIEEVYNGQNDCIIEAAGGVEVDTTEKAEKLMKETIEYFNSTLRFGERPRRLIRIEWCKDR